VLQSHNGVLEGDSTRKLMADSPKLGEKFSTNTVDKAVEKMLPNKAEPRRGGLPVNLAKYSPILILSLFTYIYLTFRDSLLSSYRFMQTVLYLCRKTVNNALVAKRNMVKKSIA
jgi:hypothetical protein